MSKKTYFGLASMILLGVAALLGGSALAAESATVATTALETAAATEAAEAADTGAQVVFPVEPAFLADAISFECIEGIPCTIDFECGVGGCCSSRGCLCH